MKKMKKKEPQIVVSLKTIFKRLTIY